MLPPSRELELRNRGSGRDMNYQGFAHNNSKVCTTVALRCDSQKQIQIHKNKFKFTKTNSNSQKQIQIHTNKFKFTQTNSNSQKQIQIHKNKFKFTKTNSNSQKHIQIHKNKFKYTKTNSNTQKQIYSYDVRGDKNIREQPLYITIVLCLFMTIRI